MAVSPCGADRETPMASSWMENQSLIQDTMSQEKNPLPPFCNTSLQTVFFLFFTWPLNLHFALRCVDFSYPSTSNFKKYKCICCLERLSVG